MNVTVDAGKPAQETRDLLTLLTPEDLSWALEVNAHTLAVWRAKGVGPAYVKLGRQVFYQLDDVYDWIRKSRVEVMRDAVEEFKASEDNGCGCAQPGVCEEDGDQPVGC